VAPDEAPQPTSVAPRPVVTNWVKDVRRLRVVQGRRSRGVFGNLSHLVPGGADMYMPPAYVYVIVFMAGVASVALGIWLPTWGPHAWGWLAYLGLIAILLSVSYWVADSRRIRRLRAEGAFDSDDDADERPS